MAFIAGLNDGTETIIGNQAFIDMANLISLEFSYAKSPLNTDFNTEVSDFATGQAAMMLGGKFSVIQMGPRGIPMKERFVRKLGFESRCASVRSIDPAGPGDMGDRVIAAARKAVEEDGAEVLTLGCAGLAGLDERTSRAVGVPVIDGVLYGVRFAEALAAFGGKTSKKGLYGPDA
jgi:allantoin racemase